LIILAVVLFFILICFALFVFFGRNE
jgi:hypothetical protein